MTDHLDDPGLEGRLYLVHNLVLELQARVAALERASSNTVTVRPDDQTQPIPITEPKYVPAYAPSPPAYAPKAPAYAPIAEPHRAGAGDSQGPVRLLAAAGGAALLLGLAFFVGYAIEQDWLAPGVRFVLGAIASALLTVAAWPIARRGYESVAGAIGGAGLGGWFAAWLVARHVHELVAAPQAFAALAVGAAACLLIADRLRLRLMAVLATVAACATPVLVAAGGDRLHELMAYQLIVILGLVILDVRQRWPELPTIGLIATWVLAAGWANLHLGAEVTGAFVVWSVVLLGVSAASAWRLLVATTELADQHHAYLRLVIAGVSTWAATAATFGINTPAFATATALLAVWHLGLGVFLDRRRAPITAVFLGLGWIQMFVVGPIVLTQVMVAWAWIAMAVAATVLTWTGLRRLRGAMIFVPAIATIAWSILAAAPWSLGLGLLAAGVPLAASIWPRAEIRERPIPWLAIAATLMWVTTVLALGPEPIVAQFAYGLIPIGVLLVWASARPTPQALLVAAAHLSLALVGAVMAVIDTRALELDGTATPGASVGLGVLLTVLAGLAVANIAAVRSRARQTEQPHDTPSVSAIGLLVAGALGLTMLLGVAMVTGADASLGQVGYSLSLAGVGLGLIVAGLRMHESSWRQAGLAALAIAAAKIVLFDLSAAAVGWRALSFVGLGAILIAGSFAYSRAYRRACEPATRRAQTG